MPRWISLFALAIALAMPVGRAAAAAEGDHAHVEVAPAKTSIYVGVVTLTTPTFVRKEGLYETTYTAKVFPYFFYNETGRLTIEMSDEQLGALARGETVEFKGRGVRADGTERRVEGKATPADAKSGKLKVRVFVSKKVELIFNTTYRFVP
ncbi:MAG TPA: hypothetical protein VM029_16325 [Opitutaceae bacterium]|nr:hypothetical protein [Opitutaceae bacterium]